MPALIVLSERLPLTVRFPVNKPSPTTCSLVIGEVVPMPTLVSLQLLTGRQPPTPAMLPSTRELFDSTTAA